MESQCSLCHHDSKLCSCTFNITCVSCSEPVLESKHYNVCSDCYREPSSNNCDTCGKHLEGIPYEYTCGSCSITGLSGLCAPSATPKLSPKEPPMTDALYAFWRYDLFPFYLGGQVSKMKDDGSVQTIEYGPGYYFKPVLLLPLAAGKSLMAKLNDLSEREAEALKVHNATYRKAVRAIIGIDPEKK